MKFEKEKNRLSVSTNKLTHSKNDSETTKSDSARMPLGTISDIFAVFKYCSHLAIRLSAMNFAMQYRVLF
jgi:hypothetical protein